MATSYKAGQYEDAFTAQNLQNWTLPKLYKEHPSAREGYTQFVANDRGHLLPAVPRSKASPWGTFMGTWEMPLKIPPAKLNLTSRSAAAASRLTSWIHKSTALTSACNGLRPQITGKSYQSPGLPWFPKTQSMSFHLPVCIEANLVPGAVVRDSGLLWAWRPV
ncbi:protein Flattop isoform X2 [Dermochelys coriacea]|uniref:protein Flattop isoform X2 n=1 Tax=Dermochelys coriacea TaxID=27794 RepID=UPI0018E86049|nr:protein Flattop isoform X2 [Dermochelys coriacea]